MDPIRLVLVEDHDMVREGLVALLNSMPDIEVVAEAGSLADGVAACHKHDPDVAICDYQLPDGLGAALPELLVDLSTRVLIVSGLEEKEPLYAAVAGGCAGFVSKSAGTEKLVDSVRRVAHDAAVFPAGALAEAARLERRTTSLALTTREAEVLGLLARAATSDEIAAALNISLHTVRNHVRSTMTKLGVSSRLEAVVVAARTGLVDLEPAE